MRLRLIGLVLLATLVLPLEAWSQVRTAAVARIKLLNKKAMDEYDGLEFETSKKILLEALAIAQGASVTKGSVLTATYLNLGVVCGAGLNDRVSAVKYFSAALRADPQAALDPARSTPILEEMFKSARDSVGTTTEPPPRPADTGFRHTPLTEAKAGETLRVRARVGEGLGARRVLLYFRPDGASGFEQLEMQETRTGHYVVDLPATNLSGRSFAYYLEAEDDGGQRLGGRGTAAEPNLVMIRESEGRPRGAASHPRFSIGVMGGLGLGVVVEGQSEHVQPQNDGSYHTVGIKTGGAIAPFHLAPELSYHITDQWHLSLQGRIQLVNATTNSTRVSVLGLARAKRYFGSGALRVFAAFGAGGGQVRFRIPLGNYDATSPAYEKGEAKDLTLNNLVDTRVAGLGAICLGGGLRYMFSTYVGLVLELNGMILVPDFAVDADLNTGLVFSF